MRAQLGGKILRRDALDVASQLDLLGEQRVARATIFLAFVRKANPIPFHQLRCRHENFTCAHGVLLRQVSTSMVDRRAAKSTSGRTISLPSQPLEKVLRALSGSAPMRSS